MKNILVIYPGFLHYRKGILDELISSEDYNFIFVGDREGFNGIRPYDFEDKSRLHHIKNYRKGKFLMQKKLLKLVLFHKAEGAIIHASPAWLTLNMASLILKLRGIKVYNWTHGLLSDEKNLKTRFYYYYFKFFFSGLLLYGNNSKNNLIKFGYNPKKIKVIFNSLDYNEQIDYRNQLNLKEKADVRKNLFKNPKNKQLIFIGRLTPWKKIDLLIDSLALLREDNENVNLLLVGDGNQKDFLQKKVVAYELTEFVNFYGPSYDEKTNFKLIASSDCCVSPGDIGLTAMHSLMYGTPIISHNDGNSQMPEYEAIKNGENGLLFEKDDVHDLKEKISSMFRIIDSASSEEISQNCYKIIDKYYNPKYQYSVIKEIFTKR